VNKCVVNIVALGIIVLFGAVGWLLFLAAFDFREPPIHVKYSHPVPIAAQVESRAEIVDAPTVKVGGEIITYREFCVTNGYTVLRNERWWVSRDPNEPPVPLPLLPSRVLDKLGCDVRTFISPVPTELKPGKWDFVVRWTYLLKGNPIAVFNYEWPLVSVEVTK
jgi:hypothetical protein